MLRPGRRVNRILARSKRIWRLVMNGFANVALCLWRSLLSHLSTWGSVVSLLVGVLSIYIALQSYRVSVATLNDIAAKITHCMNRRPPRTCLNDFH